MAKQGMYGTMPKGKMAGKAMMKMPAAKKAMPTEQKPPTEAQPVRQRYQLGGGC